MSKSKLGVAVLAAFAVMIAGAASAQAANFTAASYPAFVSGEPSVAGVPTFTFESGKTAQCETTGFAGEITAATANLKQELGVFGCTNFGAEGVIETNGCTFIFHPGTGSADKFNGTFDISCPAGKSISVTGNTCTVTIPAQTGKGPIAYERVTTAPNEVLATFQMKSAAGFSYTKAVDGASCPLSGTGAKTDGVISGGIRFQAASTSTFEQINFGIL
jgi:hypothetical protein